MLAKDVVKGKEVLKAYKIDDVKDGSKDGDMVLTFTITTDDRDRDNDVVMPNGIMTENFASNPVMLFSHRYDELPIGRTVNMWAEKSVKDNGKETNKVKAKVTFQPDENYHDSYTGVRGSMIYRMYKSGNLNAVSIGFNPLDYEPIEEKDEKDMVIGVGGTRFIKWDLLEFSSVSVPSNPQALIDRDYKKQLKSWANETIKMCDGDCPMDKDNTKSITDSDKSDLQTALGKENLSDLSAYHRRLHQWASQGNLLTGFTQADMNWLHAQVETEMCKRHKADKPPSDCADPSPLEWGKGVGDDIELKEDDMTRKCAHVDAVVGAIRDRENAKPKGLEVEGGKEMETKDIEALTKRIEELEATIKAGRVLSAANESDLRDAV